VPQGERSSCLGRYQKPRVSKSTERGRGRNYGLSPFSFGQATNGTTADFFDCTDDRFSVQQIKRIRSVIHQIDSVGSNKQAK
jgi:hypothetical protein